MGKKHSEATQTNYAFVAELLIEGLQEALDNIELKTQELVAERDVARRRRATLLDHLVERDIPDLESGTLDLLRVVFPEFAADHKVRTTFEKASRHRVPFFTKLLGDPVAYRKQYYSYDFELIRVHYRRMLLAQDSFPTGYEELAALAAQCAKLDESMEALALSRQEIEAKLISLEETKAAIDEHPGRPLAPSIKQQLDKGAVGLATTRTQSRVESDADMTDMFILWATGIPLSPRTLVSSTLFADDGLTSAAAAEFVPGGGMGGGGGATGEWTEQSAAPSQEPIATDDRLGAFS